jgi:hypothetical protein
VKGEISGDYPYLAKAAFVVDFRGLADLESLMAKRRNEQNSDA